MQYFILDDFLTESNANYIIDYFKTANWEYGNRPEDNCPPFWKSTLKDTPIFPIFKDKIFSLWKEVYISSIFANGQTKGLDSTPHFDKSSRQELEIILGNRDDINEYNDYTFMYYVCMEKKWDPSWGGETILLTEKDNGKVFLPKYNRAVVIDGRIQHYGKGPSHLYFSMRINVVCRLLMKPQTFARTELERIWTEDVWPSWPLYK